MFRIENCSSLELRVESYDMWRLLHLIYYIPLIYYVRLIYYTPFCLLYILQM